MCTGKTMSVDSVKSDPQFSLDLTLGSSLENQRLLWEYAWNAHSHKQTEIEQQIRDDEFGCEKGRATAKN